MWSALILHCLQRNADIPALAEGLRVEGDEKIEMRNDPNVYPFSWMKWYR